MKVKGKSMLKVWRVTRPAMIEALEGLVEGGAKPGDATKQVLAEFPQISGAERGDIKRVAKAVRKNA